MSCERSPGMFAVRSGTPATGRDRILHSAVKPPWRCRSGGRGSLDLRDNMVYIRTSKLEEEYGGEEDRLPWLRDEHLARRRLRTTGL